MARRNATIDDVERIVTPWRGVEEAVLDVDGDVGRVGLPVAVAADRDEAARIIELRVCFSSWPLTGGHAIRPPLLQQDPDVQVAGVVGQYQRALATGDAAAAVAAFEPDAYVREPAGASTTTPSRRSGSEAGVTEARTYEGRPLHAGSVGKAARTVAQPPLALAEARRSQPWNGAQSLASQASRNPGALRSQSGRVSRCTSRRSCQRSTNDGRPQNQ